jgi:hypothetical protein
MILREDERVEDAFEVEQRHLMPPGERRADRERQVLEWLTVSRPRHEPTAAGQQPLGVPTLQLQPGQLLGDVVYVEEPVDQIGRRPMGLLGARRQIKTSPRCRRAVLLYRVTQDAHVIEHQAASRSDWAASRRLGGHAEASPPWRTVNPKLGSVAATHGFTGNG